MMATYASKHASQSSFGKSVEVIEMYGSYFLSRDRAGLK